MTKTEKKVLLKKLIKEFLEAKDPMTLTRVRNLIFREITQLPMSSHDKDTVEDAMHLWTYNSDRFIANTKSVPIRTSLMADFDAIVKTVDASLLKN